MDIDKKKLLQRQIDVINQQNFTDLANKFEELFGFRPGKTSPRTIRRRLAYRLQEIYLGGISKEDMDILNAIADKDQLANLTPKSAVKMTTRQGTRYRRVWKGKEYEVIVAEDGRFEYQGKAYKSLSAIAREITGSRWNGKLFFGVKR